MNTAEKYVCAYIVKAVTGIAGSNPERVEEVMANSDFKFDEPFLSLIYAIAQADPKCEFSGDLVAGLVEGYAKERDEQKKREEEEKKRAEEGKYKDVTLSYNVEGDDAICMVWFGLNLMALVTIPKTVLPAAIERFEQKFPGGTVLNADE